MTWEPGAAVRGERRWIAGITLVALALRVFHLEHKSLNGGDEPFSFALAQRPLVEMFELFGFEANGTIYSILLWPLVRISEAEWMLRLPALAAGVLAVPVLWWAGRELVGPRAGLAAAALLALNPMAVFHSQYARPFSLVVLFAGISFAALSVALHEQRPRWWVLYVAATALAAYANAVTAAILVPAHLLLVMSRRRDAMRTWLISLAGIGVALIPLAIGLAIARGRRDPLYWLEKPGLRDLDIAAQDFSTGFSESKPLAALTLLLLGVVAIWASRRTERWSLLAPPAVVAWGLLPVALLFLAAQVTPVFRSAYAIAALPGVLLLVAAMLDHLPRAAARAGLAALLAVALAGTVDQTRRQVDETWRSAAGWLEEKRRPGDRVLIDIASVSGAIGYYDEGLRAPNGELAILEWEDNPFPREFVPYDDPGGYTSRSGPPPRAAVARLARGERRLFVFLAEYVEALQGDVPNGEAMRWARRNCKVTERDEVDIGAYLITGCP